MASSTPFPKVLRLYAGGFFALTAALATAFALTDGVPGAQSLAVFGALLVLSNHRSVELPSGAFVSPALMVAMGSIVVFHAEGRGLFAGALIIGMLNGVYVPSMNRRSWGWVPFNAATLGLAALAAGAVFNLLGAELSMPWAAFEVLPPAIAFTAVAWAIIVGSYIVEDRRAPARMFRELGPSFVQALPFAVLGFLLGRLYLDLGPAVMLLIIVPILIAREMFASYTKVKEAHDETVGMLIRALEAKDRYTAGHAERVATYSRYIGEQLNFMPGRLERLRFAALMHDIGKLVVPNHLLNKPGRLTADEFAKVRVHERVSVQMLSHIDFLRPIAAVSHSDHTRFDPDNPDHPIEPYIVMIADAYDAMTSTRSYRKALPQDVAFNELRDKSGVQFHPACVEALIQAIETRGERHGAGYEEAAHFDDAPDVGLGSAGLGDLLSSEQT